MKLAKIGSVLILLGIFTANLEARDYSVRNDSKIGFSVSKFLVLSVEGKFAKFSGTLSLDEQHQITALKGEVAIDSITTENAKRDAHLLEADFLDAQSFPNAQLTLVQYLPSNNENLENITGKVLATLTLHGKNQQIELDSILNIKSATPSLALSGEINIKDFGIEGSMMNSNSVTIDIQTLWE